MNWISLLIGGGFGASIVGGIVALVKAFLRRPLIKADAADQISQTALNLIKAAEKSAEKAETNAAKAEAKADEARKEAADARRCADDAERVVRWIRAAILAPNATVEGLRQLVNEGPGNGAARISGPPV